MKTFKGSRRRQLGAILFIAAVALGSALVAASASGAAGPHSRPIIVKPLISNPQYPSPNGAGDLFGCQGRPIEGSRGPRCYIPSQIQNAYGASGLLASGVNGAGRRS